MIMADELQVCDNGLWFPMDNHNDDEKPAIMQYTGLKDKNGKEVYEGDIIKTRISTGLKDGPKEVRLIGTVAMPYDQWVVIGTRNWRGHQQPLRQCSLLLHGVLIGNIYENPELLPQP